MSSAPDLAALLVVVIWGVSFPIKKLALTEIDPLAFTFVRYLGMVALGWGVLLWRRRRGHPLGVDRADLPRLALAGILGYTFYILLSTVGLSYTTAFSTGLLIGTAPLFAALLLHLLGLEQIRAAQAVGLGLSFAGVVVFLSEKVTAGLSMASLGDLISLAGALFFAAYSVANKPLLKRYPVSVFMAWTSTIGAAPILVLAAPSALRQDWGHVSAAGWASLLWTIVIPVYVAWSIWAWVIARTSVGRTTVFMYVVPVAGGVTSMLLHGESFGGLKLLGAVVILAGLSVARRSAAAEAPRPPHARPEVMTRVERPQELRQPT